MAATEESFMYMEAAYANYSYDVVIYSEIKELK